MYIKFEIGTYSDIPLALLVDMSPHLVTPSKEEIMKWVEEGKEAVSSYRGRTCYGDLEPCVVIAHKHGFDIKLPKLDGDDEISCLQKIIELIDKANIVPRQLAIDNHPSFNAKCNVHVPNNTMLRFDEVIFIEDACTVGIQEHLNEGYRIIAVCPQPDQRRPDYILGKES